jgi:hypothetical protein
MFCIKDDVQNYMSLYGLPRYTYEREKTDLMMSLIPELCSQCELSRSLQFELRLSDSDSKSAAFVREVAKMSGLVIRRRQGLAYFERVLKDNISEADIAAVIIHIRQANRKFWNIEAHLRNSPTLPELLIIERIITFLHIICDRLKDGQEWKVRHESEGPYTLLILHEDNTWRAETNPVVGAQDNPGDNPASVHHPFHFGPGNNPPGPDAPEGAQLVSMLERVQHSMR